jgi:hypothetical protein
MRCTGFSSSRPSAQPIENQPSGMRRKIGSTTLSGLKFGVAMQLKSCSVYAKEQIALDFVQVAQAEAYADQTHLIPLSMLKKE